MSRFDISPLFLPAEITQQDTLQHPWSVMEELQLLILRVFKGGSINPNIKVLKCNIGVFLCFSIGDSCGCCVFFPSLPSSTGTFGTLPLLFFSVKDPTKAPWTHRRRSEGDRKRRTPARSAFWKPKGLEEPENRSPLQKVKINRHLQGGPQKTCFVMG